MTAPDRPGTPDGRTCGCPVRDGMIYHLRGTCTDPVVAKMAWYADEPAPGTPDSFDSPDGRTCSTPETAGQAATCRAWDEWYADDHASRTMEQDFTESKYDAMHRAFHAGAQAAIAAAAPAPAAPSVVGIRSAVTGLIGMWDGMRKVHAPSGAEWEDWRATLGGLVEELSSQLDAEQEPQPQPAPGLAAPDDDGTLTGHLTIRFPADMLAWVKRFAEAEGMTVSAWIRREVEREAGRREQPQAAPELAAAMLRKRFFHLASELENEAAELSAAGATGSGALTRREIAGRIRKALDTDPDASASHPGEGE